MGYRAVMAPAAGCEHPVGRCNMELCACMLACRTLRHLRAINACTSVELLEVAGKGHAMMGPFQAEVEACMKFWARTLRAAPPVPGAVEVST